MADGDAALNFVSSVDSSAARPRRSHLSQIADFGTSRWIQHTATASTGLATGSISAPTTNMSFPWAAPEVR